MAIGSVNRHIHALLAATALPVLAVQPVLAADAVIQTYEPQITTPAPVALSPWQIRVRALGVILQNEGYVNQMPGSGLKTSSTVVPQFDISYCFINNTAAELMLGATYSNISGAGSIYGLDINKVCLLPPTLALQNDFTNFGAFKTYIDTDLNYTFFCNQKNHAVDHLKVKNTFCGYLQVSFDYMITNNWGFNFDTKTLSEI